MSRVLLGISGGVDSSTAAWMLKRDGHDVVAVTLRFSELAREQERYVKANHVCAQLGLQHRVLDMRATYDTEVKQSFARAYAQGLTPDATSMEMASVLLPALFEACGEYGCDMVATGHYASIARDPDAVGALPVQLATARDAYHDQSYYLYTLTQDQLSRMMFPLWDTAAPVTRMLAMRAGLMLAEFQEEPLVSFLEDNDVASWLESEGGLASLPGDVVDISTGARLGWHKGLHRYDIGVTVSFKSVDEQDLLSTSPYNSNKGDVALLDAHPHADSLYVIAKDIAGNRLLVGARGLAGSESCMVHDLMWTSVEPPQGKRSCTARIAWNRRPVPVQVIVTPQGLVVTFNEKVHGLRPGAPIVFYSDTMVLGGGIVAG